MEGLKEAIKFIAELGAKSEKPQVVEILGRTYINKGLIRCMKVDYPDPIETSTLTSMTDYIVNLSDEIQAGRLLIHIKSEKSVELKTELDNEGERCCLMKVSPKLPNLHINEWMDQESFIIMLQACFIDGEDKVKLLKVAGNVESQTTQSYGDDGVTQKATIKTGIASKADVIVPGRVKLTPYRTFMEVEQPESEFVFRIRDDKEPMFKLIEADGGAWKMRAMAAISCYFSETLEKEIAEKKVIVIA